MTQNSTLVVLEWLALNTRSKGRLCAGFKGMMRDLQLERSTVRKACRLLARQGNAEFYKALCDDEGYFAGAGYCISEAGLIKLEAVQGRE